jgi:xanthine dehydrogenase accessory factor
MRHLLDGIINTIADGESLILVGIVRSSGSAPRTSGARMLVRRNGSIEGTVGGGALEGRCIKEAIEMFATSLSHKEIDFSLSAASMANEGMVCGGNVSVFLQQVGEGELELFHHLKKRYLEGDRPVLLTKIPAATDGNDETCLLIADPKATSEFGPEFYDSIMKKTGRTPFLIKAGKVEFFAEPLVSPGVVYILGAGHVALATAKLAVFADFELVVIDDRIEFANKERYPEANDVRVIKSFDGCLKDLSVDDYVIIVTRGHLQDRDVLAQALRTGAGYIGMIGSRKKRDVIYNSLREDGFSESDLKRVYSPIGLSIGADTPNEIALSIVGELVQVRSQARAKQKVK